MNVKNYVCYQHNNGSLETKQKQNISMKVRRKEENTEKHLKMQRYRFKAIFSFNYPGNMIQQL